MKRFSFRFTIYENRLELVDRRGCFGLVLPKKNTIPFRNIASVDFNRLTNLLEIETSGGKRYRFRVMGGNRVKEAIEKQM